MLRMSSASRRFAPFLIDFGDMCGEIAENPKDFLPYTELRPEESPKAVPK